MRLRTQGDVLIVDGDEDSRARISGLLADAGLHTRSAASAEMALEFALVHPPQLVLAEVRLPGMCGYELLRRLRDAFGDGLPIVFMSGERTESFDRVAGMMLGADDYLTKPLSPDELIARIRRLVRSAGSNGERNGTVLTAREREVLELLAAGNSQREIADALVIAPKTCAKHIERILEKLGVHSRAQAVALAYQNDLLAVRH